MVTNSFKPERGLRQGDPLSPYLFILCAEALSALFQKAELQRKIQGFKATPTAPPITHLFFADDSIIFCRADEHEAEAVRDILQRYEFASGQKINLEKSEVTVSKNVNEQTRSKICECLGVNEVEYHKKYLGLPTLIGKSKRKVFEIILERVRKKCKVWKEKTLSRAGKEILLKSIIQAIPSYAMSCFLLPVTLSADIEKEIARFFWESTENERKIHWNSWKCLTTSKRDGGLGFRDLHNFNLAMLGKQLWRLILKPDSIIGRILKAKYFPNSDLLIAPLGVQPSYLWRSLVAARDLVKEGMAWRVGDGRKIGIQDAKWIGDTHPTAPRTFHANEDNPTKVSDLIDSHAKTWNERVIYQCFDKDEADRICAIPLSLRFPEDKIIWSREKKGNYSVKIVYHLAIFLFNKNHECRASSTEEDKGWKRLWHTSLIPRVKHFLWRACVNSLPTKENLIRRGINTDTVCELCGLAYESNDHLLLRCCKVVNVWKYGPLRLDLSLFEGLTFKQVAWTLMNFLSSDAFALFAYTAWTIWKNRNLFYMEEKQFEWIKILECAQKSWTDLMDSLEENKRKDKDSHKIHHWVPPPAGTFMMNSDIATLQNGRIGVGVIIRDDMGKAIFACRTEMAAAGSTTLLEGIAVRHGLSMALLHNITKVHVQSDNQTLIRGLCGESVLSSYCELIKDDIMDIAGKVQVLSFKFIPRICNLVAHGLAKGPNFYGASNIPPDIDVIVRDEGS